MEFNNGELCEINQFTSGKARQLVVYLNGGHNAYVFLTECRVSETKDIVGINVKPELSQIKKNDVRPNELIFIHFDKQDKFTPAVYAMREDFPRDIPHLNLEPTGYPANLCIYAEFYRDVKTTWTVARFIERIREWLKETANGTLHGQDQPLEPLLFGHGQHIILPQKLYDAVDNGISIKRLALIESGDAFKAVQIDEIPEDYKPKDSKYPPTAFCVNLPPQEHGVISHTPLNLYDVNQFMEKANFNLFDKLYKSIKSGSLVIDKTVLNSPFCIIGWFPKKRKTDGKPETTDVWVFISTKNVAEVLEDIGVYGSFTENGKKVTGPLMRRDTSKTGKETEILILNPTFTLSPDLAAILNNHEEASSISIFGIGAGAIGSHIIMNSVKTGFGKWILADEDIILPHNLARHALDGTYLGLAKAQAVAIAANQTVDEKPVQEVLKTNVMQPNDDWADKLALHLIDSDIILDMSASISVARHIVHDIKSDARRVSIFLSPSGKDLVILAEDKKRKARLDLLEMVYYRELRLNTDLVDHLATTSKTRYANSCRDLSGRISQDHVALHAAIGSNNLRRIASSDAACIKIYCADEDMQVSSTVVQLDQFAHTEIAGWQVYLSQSAAIELLQIRKGKLPNETGGVLIGAFNTQQKIIYIVDLLSATPDSLEYPNAFIRGHEGLAEQINIIQSVTAGNLTYIGEWHSHPDGAKCRPSSDDKKVIQWIDEYMSSEGLPSLMLIAGEGGQICVCVDQKKEIMEFEDVRESLAVAV